MWCKYIKYICVIHSEPAAPSCWRTVSGFRHQSRLERIRLPEKINDAFFLFSSRERLGKTLKVIRAALTQHQSERDKEAKEENKRCSSVVVDGASQHVDVAERQSVGIVSHVLPPWAPEWQLRQENMSLLPQLLARTAMGKCQSETSAFCFERLLCYLYPLQLLILNTV